MVFKYLDNNWCGPGKMRNLILFLILFLNCATTWPSATTSFPAVIINDTTKIPVRNPDSNKQDGTGYTKSANNTISVTEFGAHPGNFDNADAFNRASDYLIQHPGVASGLYIPPGNYFESRPWICEWVINGKWQFFHLKIIGDASAKSSPESYLTTITCGFKDGFGIGIQFGRDVEIENINIAGRYQPPPVNIYNIGTTLYSAWSNNTAHDSRCSPNCGIAIDPFCDSNHLAAKDGYANYRDKYLPGTGRGGTSGMKIRNCCIHNFPVGIVLTPNGYTQNDEDIDIVDDNIFACKVDIAIGQDQSKVITIDRLKSWGPSYTVLDGINYGAGTGGGSTFCNFWNIAGCVNQLINVNITRFPISLFGIYAESLFRIGGAYGLAGCNFVNCQIDLLCGTAMPAADYIFAGGPATFSGGMLRYYDGSFTHRMNLNTMQVTFKDMTINNYPITVGVYGIGVNRYPVPKFENITWYYSAGSGDEIAQSWPNPDIEIDKIHWTAKFKIPPSATVPYKIGEYVLGGPTDATRWFYDRVMNPESCNTIQIGRIISVSKDSVYLDDVGLNAYSGTEYGAIFTNGVK
jgi:hypothetical protein